METLTLLFLSVGQKTLSGHPVRDELDVGRQIRLPVHDEMPVFIALQLPGHPLSSGNGTEHAHHDRVVLASLETCESLIPKQVIKGFVHFEVDIEVKSPLAP